MAMKKLKSADGTTIAFETAGSGPAVVLVGGAFCDRSARAAGTPLAALLAPRFRVLSYDRRGRGDSEDAPEWALESEIADLEALIHAAGGSAFVYGISSGAMLAIAAAERGLAIPKLALYEPPLMLDAKRADGLREVARRLLEATASGRRSDAVEIFLTQVVQVPRPALERMRPSPIWPSLEALAHTLSYDVRITLLAPSLLARAAAVRSSTLALHGDVCPPWMRDGIQALTSAIPRARQQTLAGQTHDVDVNVLSTALSSFFSE